MALQISGYVDPGVYIQEVIVPGALNIATVPSTPTIIAHGSRLRRITNEAVQRGFVSVEVQTVVNLTGTGDSMAAPAAFGDLAGVQVLTSAAAAFPTTVVGQDITIASGLAANNGTFRVVARPSATTIAYLNATGVIDAAFVGSWSITPHDVLANRGNRRVSNTTVRADGIALADNFISYAPAVLTTLISGTYDMSTGTPDTISLEMDGNTPITIIFTAGVGVTAANGTVVTVGASTIAALATASAVEVAAAINEALSPTDATALAAMTALGYGTAYASAAVATTNAGTGAVQITSPVAGPSSDVRMFAPIANSAMTVLFGDETDRDAPTHIRISRTTFSASAVYTVDYIAVDDYVDAVAQSAAATLNFLTVGNFAGVGTFTEDTDFADAGNSLDWSNVTATGVIASATLTSANAQNYAVVTGVSDVLRIAMDGRTAVNIDLIGAASPPLGYTSATSGAATAAEVVANINAILSANAAYGARYNSVATAVGGRVVLTSPNDTTAGSNITLSNPTTLSGMNLVFGLSSTQTQTVTGTGARPASASVYFASYEYTRPSADYNNPQQFFNVDQLFAFTGALSSTNPLAVAGDIAFQNGAPTVFVVQVNDATSAGAPTQLEYQAALAAAGTRSSATDLIVLSTDLATQVDLMQHVESESAPTQRNFRRGWFGMPRSTAVGDRDTADTFVYRATQTLQVVADSPGRGRCILVAPPGVEGISKTILQPDGTTVKLDLDSTYLAVAVASRMASFTSPAESLARKTIAGFDITSGDFTPWVRQERALLAQDGCTVVTFDAGRFILLDPTSTERGGGGLISFEQISGSTQKDNINRKVAQALDANVVGIVPTDLADFIIDIKLFISNVLAAEIGSGAIGPFRDSNGNARPIDLKRDIIVEQDPNNPTQFFFRFFFNLRYPALRLFGEYSVDNPFFGAVS